METDNRADRKALMLRLVAEDAKKLAELRVERQTAETDNPLNWDLLRTQVIQTVVDFGLVAKNLPLGYRVLGGGKTPHYLVIGDHENRAGLEQFAADVLSGFLEELNTRLETELAAYLRTRIQRNGSGNGTA